MTYTWEILKFATRDQTNSSGELLTDTVVSIQWRRTGMDSEGNVASVVGYTELTAEAVALADFVSFSSLTENLVVSWLESAMSPERIAQYDTTIMNKINKSMTTEKAVPWS